MATQPFITKTIDRIEKIDKQNLARLVDQLIEDKERFLHLLNQTKEGLLLVNEKNRVAFVNGTAARILGLASSSTSLQPLDKIIEDERLRTFISKTIDERQEMYDEPFEIFLPRHSRINVTIRLNQLSDGRAGTASSYLISFLPAGAEDDRREDKSRHERLASILSLASGIAHEIGNPLNSINIHLHLLSREIKKLPKNKQTKLKDHLATVAEETKRLDEIVRNFLKANRRKPLRFELGHIHDILQSALLLYQPELAHSRITTCTQLDPNMPSFFIDGQRLNHVFTNLIKNAIEAMPKGGALTISTYARKSICEISITDTGVGMDPDIVPKIFGSHYTTKGEGSGLGLVIVYQIIREHSGRIEISSQHDHGTTVRILLPIRKEKLQLPSPEKSDHAPYF